jgi:short-subunit dehydrogenase
VRSLVIGASGGLGRALAERLAGAGHELFLVASDERDLAAQGADLALRFGVRVSHRAMDLAAPDPGALRLEVIARMGGVDHLFYVAGQSLRRAEPIEDALAQRLVAVNFGSAVRIVNAFFADMENRPGDIVGIGSVAAARGRRLNSLYGAAKRGLESYFEALRHRLVGRPCRVQFYRAGYLRTRMVFGQKLLFPALDPDAAAARIVANLGRDLGAVYLPWWWRPIMIVLRMLPWRVFKRLDF